jgi:site-specific recombinase XerC
MRALGITTMAELRQVDHRAVIAWERMQREQEGAKSSTIRRRLAALSSLFKHLVRHGVVARNPVVDVERPSINRIEGSTAAFSKIQARKILDAPPADTLAGLRDRAILSVGLSSRPRWRTARSLRTCRKRPGTATHRRRSFTTGAATTRKRLPASLRLTDTLAAERSAASAEIKSTAALVFPRIPLCFSPLHTSGRVSSAAVHRGSVVWS